jgi:S-DNA-T family DNA segregation ATPase FtsK/SpoIIIE
VEPVSVNFATLGKFGLISQDPELRAGFTNRVVAQLLSDRAHNPVEIFVIDGIMKHYAHLKGREHVHYTRSPESIVQILEQWDTELQSRYEQMLSGDDAHLAKAPLLLLIASNPDVPNAIDGDRETLERYQRITSRYKNMKMMFVFADIDNANIPYSAPEALKGLKDARNFLYFGNAGDFKVTDLPISEMRKFKKPIEAGDAYYLRENDIMKLKTVRVDAENATMI